MSARYEPPGVIVAETPDAYRFVTQPDHAELAGAFASQWGDGRFEPPKPFTAMAIAAHAHDDGWWPYDRRPRLSDDGTPETFTELSATTWVELYDRGIDEVADLDRYAGLLVSMHGTGLRRRRYGLSPSWPDIPPAFNTFVDRQEAHQRELLAALADDGDERVTEADRDLLEVLHDTGTPPTDATSRLWTNYRLLQVWDTLSLACCTTSSPPGRRRIDDVSTGAAGSAVSLGLSARDDGAVVVEPYPFEQDPLTPVVPARTVRKAAFDDEPELVAAFYAANREPVELVLQSAG